MKNQAFTLIELLVVVLIIGILAAIAVPQYQKAVIKSRYAALKDLSRSIIEAEELYYLANGTYTDKFSDLDIDVGGTPNAADNARTFDWGTCQILWDNSAKILYTNCINSNIKMYTQHYGKNINSDSAGRILCVLLYGANLTTSSPQYQICKSETGHEAAYGSAKTQYVFIY